MKRSHLKGSERPAPNTTSNPLTRDSRERCSAPTGSKRRCNKMLPFVMWSFGSLNILWCENVGGKVDEFKVCQSPHRFLAQTHNGKHQLLPDFSICYSPNSIKTFSLYVFLTVCLEWDHKCHLLFVAASQSHADYLYVLQAQKKCFSKGRNVLKGIFKLFNGFTAVVGWKIFQMWSLISEKEGEWVW